MFSMRLSSIKLAGFKSFCDPISLDFPSDHTVVVGPNGCGKSNIIDAIRWVLGESSPSGMRSDSMADVIFNGTEKNPPRGRAMVEMLFDNQKNRLTGKYKGLKEVKVKRVLERDKDSRYYINGAPCRKKDISELFAGMGLTGKSDYAIITQGAVHNIVESKPDYIKSIIEEAADITGYLVKRKETLLHIKNTKENLRSVHSSLVEMRQRVRSLEKQAEQAAIVKKNMKELEKLKEELTISLYSELVDKKEAKRMTMKKLVESIDQVKQDSALRQTQKDEKSLKAQELGSELNVKNKEQRELANRIADVEARSKYHIKTLEEKAKDLDSTRRDLSFNSKKLIQREQEIKAAKDDLGKIKRPQRTQESRQELLKLESEEAKANEEWQEIIQESLQINNVHNQCDATLKKLRVEEKDILKDLERQARSEESRKKTIQELSILNKEKIDVGKKIDLKSKRQNEIISKKDKLAVMIRQYEAKHRSLADESIKLNARLEELNKEYEKSNASSKLKQILKSVSINPVNIWGDKVEVAGGWEKAIDAVATQVLQANLTEDIDSALNKIGIRKDIQLGLIGLSEKTSESFGGLKSLAELVKQKNKPVFLNYIYACDSLAEANKLRSQIKPYQSLVTRNGDWLGTNWALLQSDNKSTSSSHSVEKNKIRKELVKNIASLKQEAHKVSGTLENIKKDRGLYEEEERQEQKALGELRQSLARIEQIIINKQFLITTWENEFGVEQEQERPAKTNKIKEIAKQIAQAEKDLTAALKLQQEYNIKKSTAEEKRSKAIIRLNQVRDMQSEEEEHKEREQERREALLSNISSLETAITEVQRDNVKLEGRQKELVQENLRAREITKEDDNILRKLNEENKALENLISKEENELANLENELRIADRKISKAEKDIAVFEEKMQQIRGDESQMELELGELEKRLPQQIKKDKKGGDSIGEPSVLKTRIKILERDIMRSGDVNMLALADYKEEKEKYDKFTEQEQQINTAISNLNKAIRRIDRESKTKFDSTFKKVNSSFGKFFKTLTQGGKAYLELENDENRGVRIMACPPGKRNNMLSLLSGGEKTVTAIAFIMAIFQLNPAPFCLLDEADAMLDDSNVIRFNRMMKEISTQGDIQFILITHSKLSMQEAKHLIGITMSDPGISRIVSVDMEKALELSQEEI